MQTIVYNFDKIKISKNFKHYYLNNLPLTRLSVSKRGLIALSKVKKHVRDNLDSLPLIPLKKFNMLYAHSRDIEGGTKLKLGEKFISFDVSNCFPNIALNNGLITQELFDRINKLKKNERLMTLGAVSSESITRKINTDTGEFEDKKNEAVSKEFFNTLLCVLEKNNMRIDKFFKTVDVLHYFFYCDAVFIEISNFHWAMGRGVNLFTYLKSLLPYSLENELLTIIEEPKEIVPFSFCKTKKTQIVMKNKKGVKKTYVI